MRVAFYSVEASTLAWARRLLDEHTPVLVYIAKPYAKRNGEGIVPLADSFAQWRLWGDQDANTIWFFDCTDAGHVADQLRRAGKRVVGGGTFMDRLENDRAFGQKFAEMHGIAVPPTREFSSVRDAIKYMRETKKQQIGDGGWAWKPDRNLGTSYSFVGDTDKVTEFCERQVIGEFGDSIRCIVQERIPGVALSTARWWNGARWTGPFEGTLEEKKFMPGDVGPATGCSLNTVWFYENENPQIAEALAWEKLAISFRAKQAPPGLYDVNAIVNKQGAYFLEWTPRLGVDSELTSFHAFSSLTSVLERIATGGDIDDLVRVDTGYHGVRLSVPPYPCEHKDLAALKIPCKTPVEGLTSLWHGDFVFVGLRYDVAKKALWVADPYGFVGMAFAEDRNVRRGFEKIAKAVKTFEIPNLQYRTDAADIVTKDIEDMQKAGWETTRYLRIDTKARVA